VFTARLSLGRSANQADAAFCGSAGGSKTDDLGDFLNPASGVVAIVGTITMIRRKSRSIPRGPTARLTTSCGQVHVGRLVEYETYSLAKVKKIDFQGTREATRSIT